MAVTVSTKGQLVIPAKIRKRYRIEARSKVEFIDTGKEILLIPIPRNSFKASRGVLKGVTTKDLIEERRKERFKEQRKACAKSRLYP